MAASVTARLQALFEAQQRRTATGAATVRGLLDEVRQQIQAELLQVTEASYSAATLRSQLASIERQLADFEGRAQTELGGLLESSWDDGAAMLTDATAGSGLYFGFATLSREQLTALKEHAFYRIGNLSNDAWQKVRAELSLGVIGQKNPHQVTQAIMGTIEKPGVFRSLLERCESITKLEMGTVYSAATAGSIEQAQSTVPQLEKQWWHAGHPVHPRASHVRLHGQHKAPGEKFLVGSVILRYPRDPQAPISERINCGCQLVPWHPLWDNEDLPPATRPRPKTGTRGA